MAAESKQNGKKEKKEKPKKVEKTQSEKDKEDDEAFSDKDGNRKYLFVFSMLFVVFFALVIDTYYVIVMVKDSCMTFRYFSGQIIA